MNAERGGREKKGGLTGEGTSSETEPQVSKAPCLTVYYRTSVRNFENIGSNACESSLLNNQVLMLI